MTSSRLIRCLLATPLLVGALLMAACASGPKPTVHDFDTYQVITLGPAKYITPNGVRVVDEGKGYVEHEVEDLPGTTIRVEIDTAPPRSLRFDADRESRQFMREVPRSVMTNVQHDEREGRQYIKAFLKGQNKKTEEMLFGSMQMIREQDKTLLLKIVGPEDQREEIVRLGELLTEEIHFGVSGTEYRKTGGQAGRAMASSGS